MRHIGIILILSVLLFGCDEDTVGVASSNLTKGGTGDRFLADDGTYKEISGIGASAVTGSFSGTTDGNGYITLTHNETFGTSYNVHIESEDNAAPYLFTIDHSSKTTNSVDVRVWDLANTHYLSSTAIGTHQYTLIK